MKRLIETSDADSWSEKALARVSELYTIHAGKLFVGLFVVVIIAALGAVVNGNMEISSDGINEVWPPRSNFRSENRDALKQAIKQLDSVAANISTPTRSQSNVDNTLLFLFDSEDEGEIFTPANLQSICVVENLVYSNEHYQDYCILASDGTTCANQTNSIVWYFYQQEPNSLDCTVLLDETYVRDRAAGLYLKAIRDETRFLFGSFVGNDALVNLQPPTLPPADNATTFTRRTMSSISFGGPLAGYSEVADDFGDQFIKFRDTMAKSFESDLFDHFGLSWSIFRSAYRHNPTQGNVQIQWFSRALEDLEVQRTAYGDLAYALMAMIAVWIWVRIHIGSTFIATASMAQIVLSLPLGGFIYGTVFGIPYFDFIHILVIFLILGIGADDVFVYVDAWRQAAGEPGVWGPDDEVNKPQEAIARRVKFALSRTSRAVFITSLTTAIAFLSQAGSPVMPIRAVGIFAAIVVLSNYVLAVTLTPVAVVLWCRGCLCMPAQKPQNIHKASTFKDDDMNDSKADATDSTKDITSKPKAGAAASQDGMSKIDQLIQSKYVEPMLRSYRVQVTKSKGFDIRPIALLCLALSTGYGAQAVYFTGQLGPPGTGEPLYASNHMWEGLYEEIRVGFLTQSTEFYESIDVVFGISGIDRSNYNTYRPLHNLGEPEYDEDFDIYPIEAQQFLLDTCVRIRETPCDSDGCAIPKVAWGDEVDCFMESFQTWMNTTHDITIPTNAISKADFLTHLKSFRKENLKYETSIGFVDDKLKFVVITFLCTMSETTGFDLQDEVISTLDNLEADIRRDAPAPVSTVYLNGGFIYVWFELLQALAKNLTQGIGISSPVIFFLLLITTGNIQIAASALASVLLVVCSLLGVAVWLGWATGIAESIAGVLVIGFAVDYSVHFGHMYMDAADHGIDSRAGRVRFATRSMGGTIVANAITTFLSGVFMFFAQLVFFNKLAVMITGTIGFSVFFSFFFFMAQCAAFGPKGSFLTIKFGSIIRKAVRMCRGGAVHSKTPNHAV